MSKTKTSTSKAEDATEEKEAPDGPILDLSDAAVKKMIARAKTRGFRLNIPAGTAIRFEPGQTRTVELVAYAGQRHVYGFRAAVMGPPDVKP